MDEELPRVTAAMLRRADDMCRFRLAREHAGTKRRANVGADARFAVSNRVTADARLAQAEPGTPRPEAFVDPSDLEPEQRALYRAAVAGYLAVFGDRTGSVVELGWRSVLAAHGVELVGDPGVAIERPDGGRELRVLKLGNGRPGSPLLDDVEARVALVRTAEWAPDELHVVAVDLLTLEVHDPVFGAAAREEARAWVDERVALIRAHAADGRPRPGADCNGCAFVAKCPRHG